MPNETHPPACERPRELLTLRLYDELAPGEASALDEHLATCGVCRRFADELGLGLGALRVHDAVSDDLPADWTETLRAEVDAEPAATRPSMGREHAFARSALTFATGLAAGLLLMLSQRPDVAPERGGAAPPGAERSGSSVPERVAFARATPPPAATSRGQLAHLGRLLAD